MFINRGTRASLVSGTVLTALVFMAGACSNSADADQDIRTLSFGYGIASDDPVEVCGVIPMAEAITESGVGLEVETFPQDQLGTAAEMLDAVSNGSQTFQIPVIAQVAEYYEPISVLDAAFAFDSPDNLMAAVDGETVQAMYAEMEEATGAKVLESWFFGTRHVTADIEAVNPDALAGQRMRAIPGKVTMANVRSLGAEPTPVPISELYLALQQGTVDAQENPLSVTGTRAFYEVQDVVTLTGHAQNVMPVLVSQVVWDSLTEEQQAVIQDAATSVRDNVQDCVENEADEWLDRLEEEGMTVVTEIDTQAFRDSAMTVFQDEFDDEWLENYERLRAL